MCLWKLIIKWLFEFIISKQIGWGGTVNVLCVSYIEQHIRGRPVLRNLLQTRVYKVTEII